MISFYIVSNKQQIQFFASESKMIKIINKRMKDKFFKVTLNIDIC